MVKRPGQATVEGAFLIPLIFLLLLMMLQPGILLFDRTVMKSAAAEACRMLATCETQEDRTACEEALRRRLGSYPSAGKLPCPRGRLQLGDRSCRR